MSWEPLVGTSCEVRDYLAQQWRTAEVVAVSPDRRAVHVKVLTGGGELYRWVPSREVRRPAPAAAAQEARAVAQEAARVDELRAELDDARGALELVRTELEHARKRYLDLEGETLYLRALAHAYREQLTVLAKGGAR